MWSVCIAVQERIHCTGSNTATNAVDQAAAGRKKGSSGCWLQVNRGEMGRGQEKQDRREEEEKKE